MRMRSYVVPREGPLGESHGIPRELSLGILGGDPLADPWWTPGGPLVDPPPVPPVIPPL